VLEPFMIPWQSDIGFLDKTRMPDPPSFQRIFDNIKEGVYYTKEGQSLQVVKDMPCHFSDAQFEQLLAEFPAAHHAFLVRHPFQMIPSYLKALSQDANPEGFTDDIIIADTSYEPMVRAAKRLKEASRNVLVIDAGELLAEPESRLRDLCDHIGVDFSPALLHWEPNKIPSSWLDLEHFEGWLDTVVSSNGWMARPRSPPTYPQVDSALAKKCVDDNLPLFEQLLTCNEARS
ncbi:unnamed protein product, partial [Symbiodinium natans]